jgi:hypothetical protein
MTDKYQHVTVKLTGRDGNAFAILGTVVGALHKAGAPQKDISAFLAEAKAGDYDHLLATCMRWVDVT